VRRVEPRVHSHEDRGRRRRCAARGFTLLEVVVALAVGGVLLLGARRMLETVGDGAQGITEAAKAADREANGERLLRALLGRLEVGTDSTRTFSGEEQAARFTSWCDVPAGWQERCIVTLVVGAGPGGATLTASLSTGEVVVVRGGFHTGTLCYLSDAGAGGTWFRRWGTGITAPIAIGVVLDGDTLIVPIGERG
jgi:prepilin-type N-terminal cleavage/methylation domain-containing protein